MSNVSAFPSVGGKLKNEGNTNPVHGLGGYNVSGQEEKQA